MHPDLQHLIRLQQLDTDIDSARRRIADIPGIQQALAERLAAQQAAVADAKQRLADSQTARREIEKEVASIQTRLSKYKDQLMEVKTNKEYQAMQKEITVAEQEVRAHEDRLLEHMEQAETFAVELKAAEGALKTEQAEVAREQKILDAERAALEQEIARLMGRRGELVRMLSRDALALFERIAHGRKGVAVAEARDDLCTVCHVRLRPQVFNDVRRNDTITQCESCTRILYFVPAAATGGAASPS